MRVYFISPNRYRVLDPVRATSYVVLLEPTKLQTLYGEPIEVDSELGQEILAALPAKTRPVEPETPRRLSMWSEHKT